MGLIEDREFVFSILSLAVVIALVTIVLLGFVAGYQAASCHILAERNLEHSYVYDFFNGCLIESDSGVWIPAENYRIFE